MKDSIRASGLAFCLGAALWFPRARAQDLSPFLPPSVAAGGSASAGETCTLELRGIMSTSKGFEYCVYDSAKKRSVWVAPNQTGPGFVLAEADGVRGTVTLVRNGQRIRLTLHEAKIHSGGFVVDANSMVPAADSAAQSQEPGAVSSEFSPETRARLTPEAQEALLKADQEEREQMQAARRKRMELAAARIGRGGP
jgi:hypothetical protein